MRYVPDVCSLDMLELTPAVNTVLVRVTTNLVSDVQTALTERQWTDVEKTERITRLHPFRGL